MPANVANQGVNIVIKITFCSNSQTSFTYGRQIATQRGSIQRFLIILPLRFSHMTLFPNRRIKNATLMAAFIIAFMCMGVSCENDDGNDIPYADINIGIDPNSTLYWKLNAPGGWEYLVGSPPSKGVLVYRSSLNEFVAYERTCPFDPQAPDAVVAVESSNITMACPVCKSKFIMLDGSPFAGPSKKPMRKYRTNYTGSQLYIFN